MKTSMKLLENTQRYRRTPKGVLTNMFNHMKNRNKVDFTLAEFHSKYLNDKLFNSLFRSWIKSGCNIQLKPSIDRIDSKQHYCWDNIQMMTWSKNREKQAKVDGKRGRRPAVLQILNGKVVNRFESQYDTIRKLGLHQGNLSSVLNGKRKYIGGYTYIYENPELLK